MGKLRRGGAALPPDPGSREEEGPDEQPQVQGQTGMAGPAAAGGVCRLKPRAEVALVPQFVLCPENPEAQASP